MTTSLTKSLLCNRALSTRSKRSNRKDEEKSSLLSSSAWSDEELVARLSRGEPDALPLIYDRYASALFRLLNALLSSASDAEDALQEVFVALATRRIARIRHLKSYLFVAARHQAFTTLRRRQRSIEGFSLEALSQEVPATDPAPSSPNWTGLLARLPLEQREVIALRVWEQMTFAEIAEVVRAPLNTVMSRYRYGIARLRQWSQEQEDDRD